MNLILLATHLGAFLAVAIYCHFNAKLAGSSLALALGWFGAPIFALVTLVLLDFSNHAGNGTTGAWYLIFSVVTLGGVPLVTHASAGASGVFGYRVSRWMLQRRNEAGTPAC